MEPKLPKFDLFTNLPPDEKFNFIRKYPAVINERSPVVNRLPQIVRSDQDCQDLFAISKDVWVLSFNNERLQQQMSSLVSNETPGGVSNLAGELKNLRRAGNFLKSANRLLTPTHRGPNEFNILVRMLGILNDEITTGNIETTKTTAEELSTHLRITDIQTTVESIQTAGKKEFDEYIKASCNKTLQILQKPSISLAELHSIRKKTLRDLMFLYTMEAMRNNGNCIDQYQLIRQHYDRLDEIRLGQVKNGANEEQQLTLPQDITNQVTALFKLYA